MEHVHAAFLGDPHRSGFGGGHEAVIGFVRKRAVRSRPPTSSQDGRGGYGGWSQGSHSGRRGQELSCVTRQRPVHPPPLKAYGEGGRAYRRAQKEHVTGGAQVRRPFGQGCPEQDAAQGVAHHHEGTEAAHVFQFLEEAGLDAGDILQGRAVPEGDRPVPRGPEVKSQGRPGERTPPHAVNEEHGQGFGRSKGRPSAHSLRCRGALPTRSVRAALRSAMMVWAIWRTRRASHLAVALPGR